MNQQVDYGAVLGDRLRNVRQQQGLSLNEVEAESGGELKASVVGAYERGERAVSVPRLRQLAEFYGVPATQLLPRPDARPALPKDKGGLRLDLTRLSATGEGGGAIQRFATGIQSRRGDYNGHVLTIRDSDLDALAVVLDTDAAELRSQLVTSGIAAER